MSKKKELEIISAPIAFVKNGINIHLPIKYCQYLGISKKGKDIKMFIIPTGNTIQLSVGQPMTSVPILTDKDEFAPQLS